MVCKNFKNFSPFSLIEKFNNENWSKLLIFRIPLNFAFDNFSSMFTAKKKMLTKVKPDSSQNISIIDWTTNDFVNLCSIVWSIDKLESMRRLFKMMFNHWRFGLEKSEKMKTKKKINFYLLWNFFFISLLASVTSCWKGDPPQVKQRFKINASEIFDLCSFKGERRAKRDDKEDKNYCLKGRNGLFLCFFFRATKMVSNFGFSSLPESLLFPLSIQKKTFSCFLSNSG